jgi:hypothetical protein
MTSLPKLSSIPWSRPCGKSVARVRSPSTATRVRFLTCLNIQAEICPPQRPDKNNFVERYNRTYEYEGIRIYRPATLDQAREMSQAVRQHYNFECPKQACSCGNQPPRSAFPDLPTFPRLPQVIDPDGWLKAIDGRLFIRRVNSGRTVKVDKRAYLYRP